MTRAAFVFAAALVLLVVVPAVVSGLRPGRDAELGYGDRVPTVQPGFEAIDNTPTHPPGVKRVRAASASSVKTWTREPGTVNGYPCGGDLPTCAVLACESGGNPHAQNPRSSASGLWQILDSTWAGFGGYARAFHAPVDVQNEKARLLWAGGAGAFHWKACL